MQEGMARRPTGVTILAVIYAIGGVLSFLSGLALLGLDGLGAALGGVEIAGGLSAVVGIVAVVFAIGLLAVAYGFWTLKPWAWQWAIVLAIIELILAVLGAVGIVFTTDIVSSAIGIATIVIVIWYLNKPEVRTAFGAPATGWPFIERS